MESIRSAFAATCTRSCYWRISGLRVLCWRSRPAFVIPRVSGALDCRVPRRSQNVAEQSAGAGDPRRSQRRAIAVVSTAVVRRAKQSSVPTEAWLRRPASKWFQRGRLIRAQVRAFLIEDFRSSMGEIRTAVAAVPG